MKKGIVIGKFMPLHEGHIDLINFAASKVDELIVIVGTNSNEPIPGKIRFEWVKKQFELNSKIIPFHLEYNEKDLSSSSVPDIKIAEAWAKRIEKDLGNIDVVISSEHYGKNVAKFLNAENIEYDITRTGVKISATQIRERPYKFWHLIPKHVRDYYRQVVVLTGTESTGKTTIATLLAKKYSGLIVNEVGREYVDSSQTCTYEDLVNIAKLHTQRIKEYLKYDVPLLIIDTDINITASYASYLFNKELPIPEAARDLTSNATYIYLKPDCEFVQDGTRLNKKQRDELSISHAKFISKQPYKNKFVIGGDFAPRTILTYRIINSLFKMSDI